MVTEPLYHRCHKHHQYSKSLPADSDFRATGGRWYAAVLKRAAPRFLVKVSLTREPTTECVWLKDSWWETDLWAENNMFPSWKNPQGVEITYCTYRKRLRLEPGETKGLHLGTVHPLICICSEVNGAHRGAGRPWTWQQNVQHCRGCLLKQMKARSWKALINRTNSI